MARPRLDLDPDVLRDLAGLGLPDAIIADRLGCSTRTVLRYRAMHGIPPSTRPTAPLPASQVTARYRARLAAETALAPFYGLPWTPDDDAVVLALPPRRSAARLGRTWHACRARRDRLRRKGTATAPAS